MSDETQMNKMQINFMILRNQVIINFDSKTFTVNQGSDEYENVLHILKNYTNEDPAKRTKLEDLIPIVDPQGVISSAIPNGEFVIQKGKIYSNGEQVSGYISQKLIEFVEQGLPYLPLFNFWKRIKNNPSNNSKDQLYRFLEINQVPLTEEGKFVAYKSVRPDMKDHHSGTFQYKLNQVAEMPREQVVDDPNHACGPGLHIGAYSYAASFGRGGGSGSIILEVEVDPADVVSVPKDHSSQKIRACRFIPVAICEREYSSPIVITKKDKPAAPAQTSAPAKQEALKSSQEQSNIVLIGRDEYTFAVLDEAFFESVYTLYKEPIDIRPSKAASALQKLCAEYGKLVACVRFVDAEAKCYAVKYVKDDVVTCVVFSPIAHTFVVQAVATSNVDTYKVPITVGRTKYVASVVRFFGLEDSNYDNIRTLSRSKYPVALLELDAAGLIKKVIRGVNKSTGLSSFIIDIGVANTFVAYNPEQ